MRHFWKGIHNVRHFRKTLFRHFQRRQSQRAAHLLGMTTTATMVFGSIETSKEIVENLVRVREIQDQMHGFTAFIPWTYQPGNTELGGRTATAVEYLKTLALPKAQATPSTAISAVNAYTFRPMWKVVGPFTVRTVKSVCG